VVAVVVVAVVVVAVVVVAVVTASVVVAVVVVVGPLTVQLRGFLGVRPLDLQHRCFFFLHNQVCV